MKKLLFIFFLSLVYSCQSGKVKVYDKETVIPVDTLDIERIKIETH